MEGLAPMVNSRPTRTTVQTVFVSKELFREMPEKVARAMAERPDDDVFVIFVGGDRKKLVQFAERIMWQYGAPER
jgi:hypothetical protein